MIHKAFRKTVYKTGLYWFTNDLRLHDNRALLKASKEVDQLFCIYLVEPAWFKPNTYNLNSIGNHRWRFLHQSLTDLRTSLDELGQELHVIFEYPLSAISQLIAVFDIDAIYRSQNAGYRENLYWQTLKQRYAMLHFEQLPTHTLFSENSLPFALTELPETFSNFRKTVEPVTCQNFLSKITYLPPKPKGQLTAMRDLPPIDSDSESSSFKGGATEGNKHIQQYFNSQLPHRYKHVRDSLDGWENSTKFSPWLANGSISIRQLIKAVEDYQNNSEVNESNYRIIYELLWREYFQWYAHTYRTQLFSHTGIHKQKTLTGFYPERYQRWCKGNTPFPLVNACMNQLNATGYISNRGRQIVASCFVNELDLDWRYGAAYFEQQLIDYDVAVNWGNWQYLAGVGADPQGKLHLDINKQTALHDPDRDFITKWQGDMCDGVLDSVDAADWPISS